MSLEHIGFSAMIADKLTSSSASKLAVGLAIAGGAVAVGVTVFEERSRLLKKVSDDAQKALETGKDPYEREKILLKGVKNKYFNPYLGAIRALEANVNVPRFESDSMPYQRSDYPENVKRNSARLDLHSKTDVYEAEKLYGGAAPHYYPKYNNIGEDHVGISAHGDEVHGFAGWIPDEDEYDFDVGADWDISKEARNLRRKNYFRSPYGRDVPREYFTKTYAFAVPDDHIIERMKEFAPSYVEVGSGTGYWAHVLNKAGVPVEPYDNGDWDDTWKLMWQKPVGKFPTEIPPSAALLLVWPPGYHHYEKSEEEEPRMDVEALKLLEKSGGKKVVFVGDDEEAVGSYEFKDALSNRYDRKAVYAIPQWDGIHDRAGFYVRKPSDEELERRESLMLAARERMEDYRKRRAAE